METFFTMFFALNLNNKNMKHEQFLDFATDRPNIYGTNIL